MRRALILFVALILAHFAQSAFAVPPGTMVLHDSLYDVDFPMGTGSAQVDCEVHQFTSSDSYLGKFLYTYQISNNSSVGLSFFSIGVSSGAVVVDWGWDTGTINPLQWTPAIDNETSLVQSVDALFNSTIKNGQSSALLWFVSDNVSASGKGALFGTLAGIPTYADADLLAPVPEPATIFLFAVGGALVARAHVHPQRNA